MDSWTKTAAALLLSFAISACGSDAEPSAGDETDAADAEPQLLVEQSVALLEPSDVRIGAVGAGTMEGGQAARSETRRIDQILSELEAEQVDEGIRINLPEAVLFEFDEAELLDAAVPTLEQLAELATHFAAAPIRVEGHTDSQGADDYNQRLSERRAAAVGSYLVETLGVEAERIRTRGFGSTDPVAPNEHPDGSDNPEGRQQNRRVEVIIEEN